MRVGEAYFTEDLGYDLDEWSLGYGETTWQVDVIKRIDDDLIVVDAYFGAPSEPWSFGGEYSRYGTLYVGKTPMSELEKESYRFAEMSREETEAQQDYEWSINERPTGEGYSQLGNVNIGVILGVGGIVVAFMMMR